VKRVHLQRVDVAIRNIACLEDDRLVADLRSSYNGMGAIDRLVPELQL
jgi:hypothetical protein